MAKKNVIRLLGGFGIIVLIVVVGLQLNLIRLPIQRYVETSLATDLSDDRKMVGISHNVFVGKVLKKVGAKDDDIIPTTQFNVEVLYNIKGELQGTVTTSQEGGYRNGILYIVHDGDTVLPDTNGKSEFLQPGEIYLFFTRYDERNNWHAALFDPNATKLLPWDKNLNATQLQAVAQQDERVKVLREAYKNEILLDADVREGNTRNSYQSLRGNQ